MEYFQGHLISVIYLCVLMHIESHFSFLRFNFDRLPFIERKFYCFYTDKLPKNPIVCLNKTHNLKT